MLGGELHVLYEAEEDGRPIVNLAGETLTFGLRLTNPWFDNFTAAVISDPKQIPSYSNSAEAGKLAPPAGIVPPQEIRAAGFWGTLSIKVDAAFYGAPPAFSISFAAKQGEMQYFVVADGYKPADFDSLFTVLAITDNGFGDDGRAQVTFTKVPKAAFKPTDLSPSLLGSDEDFVMMFRSNTLIARRERGLSKIQLKRNGDVLIEQLPQPTPDRPRAISIVHVSKP
jgi:hypothetical protein